MRLSPYLRSTEVVNYLGVVGGQGVSLRVVKFLGVALVGLVRARSCHLNRVAAALPECGAVKVVVQRLRRWLQRESLQAERVLGLGVRRVVGGLGEEMTLAVDRTEWPGVNLLLAGVCFRGRALPVAVMCLAGPKATSGAELQALLGQAAAGLPAGASPVVVADKEFGNSLHLERIRAMGWHFCLRVRKNTWVTLPGEGRRQVRQLLPPPGHKAAYSKVTVTLKEWGPTNLVLYWKRGEREPWALVTDLFPPAGPASLPAPPPH